MNNLLSFSIVGLMMVLLFTLTDPFMYWMPIATQMIALTIATALVCFWAGFIIREGAGDERETVLRMHAGRAAFLSGVIVLTLALVIQGLAHAIDPWIPAALAVMVFAKLSARWYSDRNS